MRARPAACGLALTALLLGGCSRGPQQPDILLVSIEGLDWMAMALDGGSIATPRLTGLASDAADFQGLVSPHPGGAPAALTLISGLAPSEHGLRRLDGAAHALRVPTLGDLFRSRGWHVGAFSQAPLFGGLTDLAAGFDAWMMPSEAQPLGLPATMAREPATVTAAHAQHWLRGLPLYEPAFAWVHFEAPVMPGTPAPEAASRVAELDRLIGLLVDQLEQRAIDRRLRPVVVVTTLSGRGEEVGASLDAAFLLDESSLRVRALARVPGLTVGEASGLAGLDELHDLLAGIAEPERASRLRELASGSAAQREAVLVETQLPMTSLGGLPSMRALRAPGVVAPVPDPLVVQALAADSGWPGGFAGPSAEELLPEWRELRAAASELSAGDAGAAGRRLERLRREAGPRARAASLLLALSEASAGRGDRAVELLGALAASVPASDPGHRQAKLALAEVERGAGRPERARAILERLVESHPDDLTALLQLGAAREQAGDPAASLATLSRALESHPRDARVLAAVAGVHSSRGRPDLAVSALGDALRQRPVDGRLLLAASDAALAAGDFWTALIRLNRHQEIYGERADTTHRMGLIYHREQRWASAIVFHGHALDQDASFAPARLAMADALLRQGQEEEGRAFLAVARARAPRSGEPCQVLVAWLLDAGREADGRAELERCLAAFPGDAGLNRLAGAVNGS